MIIDYNITVIKKGGLTMNTIIYTNVLDKNSGRLVKLFFNALDRNYMKVVYSLPDIFQFLCVSKFTQSIIILHVCSQDILDEIVLFRNHLEGYSIILILPDIEKATLKKAKLLCPKFIYTYSSDFNRIKKELKRMIATQPVDMKKEIYNTFERRFEYDMRLTLKNNQLLPSLT